MAGWLRCGLAVLSLVAAFGESDLVAALPWALGVLLLELLAGRAGQGRQLLAVLAAQVLLVAVAVLVTFPETRALLPLLLVPAYRAGEVHGLRVGLRCAVVLAAAPVLAAALHPGWSGTAAAVQWAALAVAIALLGAWSSRLERGRTETGTEMAWEAGQLLGRLQDLARALPAGFDVPAVSEMLVDEALAAAPAERVAVLVHVGPDEVSPVVVRGTDRVVWRDPVHSPGTANDAWVNRRTVHDVRQPDVNGRRKGSAMLVVPIADRDDELLGLLILERLGPRPFTAAEVTSVEHAVAAAAPRVHAALAFVELRSLSEVAERERLAREMHDGVAQDLVVVGFGIDAVQRRLRDRDPELAGEVLAVRSQLNQTIRDIRYSIATLRSSVRSERGLGAALSSAAQSVGPATGAEVTFSLKESAFRLPAHVESAMLRLAQDFFADIRTAGDVSTVQVSLETLAPNARLELRHDGSHAWEPEPVFTAALGELGGAISQRREGSTWVSTLSIGTWQAGEPADRPAAPAAHSRAPRSRRVPA
jgi:signal transduction histidine kinase